MVGHFRGLFLFQCPQQISGDLIIRRAEKMHHGTVSFAGMHVAPLIKNETS
jgi:hypothetical protein